jgi:uncharacterized protein (TIGR03435 family)
MVAHWEMKGIPIYALVVAKIGPKMTEATGDKIDDVRINRTRYRWPINGIERHAWSMEELTNFLTILPSQRKRPVVDHTGLDLVRV